MKRIRGGRYRELGARRGFIALRLIGRTSVRLWGGIDWYSWEFCVNLLSVSQWGATGGLHIGPLGIELALELEDELDEWTD